MATTSTSNDVSTFVEDVKKKPDRTDSMLSGARTPSTVGGLTPGFRGRLDSSDPFWGLEFTEEMAMAALKKEIKKRVWPESRVHTDGSAKHRTWRLDPADFDMGHMFAVGEDTDGYVMKFGDFEMEYFFGDPNPPPEAVPLSWNMWEIELFGPMHENGVEGMFKPEPIRDVDRFVEHGHDYDTIEESELSDFWECWELSPVAHIGVVDAVMDLLKEPVYVLTIDQSVLKGAEWLSLIRVHPVIEYPIILSNSGSSCLPQSGLLETARPPQPALCHGVLPLLAGGIMQARLKALLNRLTHHEIIEADPRVQGESIRKWLWRAVLDKSLTEAWPSTKWLGPYEKLYVEAQAVFIRDPGAISSLLNAEHISGHTIVDVSACPGLAVARAAVAARVLLIEGSDMLNIIEYDVSCMAQEVATLIVISAMETTWPYQQQQQQEGAGGTVDTEVFSHRFEREPWVPLSRLSAAFSYSNSPLIPHQWRPKEPSQFTLLAERLSRAIETGKVYMGPKYLPASYSLRDRARSSLDYLSWCLTQQPHRCRLSPREALSPLASWWEYVGLRLADLVWGIRDLMRLHQPGVLLHAYWLEHWPSATTKPPTKPSVYGADAFAWKRPAREGCDTLALRVPPPPRYTVIDAVGSAAAIPIDHLASYLELRSSDMAQSWRSYPTLNHFAELTATFTKWLFILALLHSTVPSVDILPSRLGPDSSSVFTHSLLAVACCSDTGLWVGLLGTWIKIPVSLIGEWPVDNYVLGLLILPLISRSKLQWPALAYPIVEEWALGSIALSTLLPAVGIQAVWLYVLGAILGNIICREIEAQAGIAALISYLVGETIFGHRSDFDSLSLVWFQDLSPSAFAFVYAVLASITYRVFSPRCRRELMSLKRGEWRVSCGAVVAFGLICSKFVNSLLCVLDYNSPLMFNSPSPPRRPVMIGTCPGEAARNYLAWLGPRATAAVSIIQDKQPDELAPTAHFCDRADSPTRSARSVEELLAFDMDTLPRARPEIISMPPAVPVVEPHEPASWSSWGSGASVSHSAVCAVGLSPPAIDHPVAPAILSMVYATVVGRVAWEDPSKVIAEACLTQVYYHIDRNGAPCCRLARTVPGVWKGGWHYCCFCEMDNLILSAASSFPSDLAHLEVGSIIPKAEEEEVSLVDCPSPHASVATGSPPIEAMKPTGDVISAPVSTEADLSPTASRPTCVLCPLGESIVAEHVALCTLARLNGTLLPNISLKSNLKLIEGSNAPPNSSRFGEINANSSTPGFHSSPELITAFDGLLVEEAFLASLDRRQAWRQARIRRQRQVYGQASRMNTSPISKPMPVSRRPISGLEMVSRVHRPSMVYDKLPYSLYVEKVEKDFIATFCKSPRIPPHFIGVPPLESSSHMLARYILHDLYFTIAIIYALERGHWATSTDRDESKSPPAVTFRLTRMSEQPRRCRSFGCQTDLSGLIDRTIDVTLGRQSLGSAAGHSEEAALKRNEARLVIADSMTISLQCTINPMQSEEAVQAPRIHEDGGSNQSAAMTVEVVSSAVQTMSPRQRLEAGTFCDLSNTVIVPPDTIIGAGLDPALNTRKHPLENAAEADDFALTVARRRSVELVGSLTSRCACRMMARCSLVTLFRRIFAPAQENAVSSELPVMEGISVGIQCGTDDVDLNKIELAPVCAGLQRSVASQTNSPRPSHLRLLLFMAAQRRLSNGCVDSLTPAEEVDESCGPRATNLFIPTEAIEVPTVHNAPQSTATPFLVETLPAVSHEQSSDKPVTTSSHKRRPSKPQASAVSCSDSATNGSSRRSLIHDRGLKLPLYRRAYSSVKPLRAKASDEHRYELRFSPTCHD